MNFNLFVFEPDTGEIKINQSNGSDRLIDRYGEAGRMARIFASAPHSNVDHLFVRRERLALRPQLNARLSKTVIRADGMDAAKIAGVPKGAVVSVSDGRFEVEHIADGKVIHIVAGDPARYTVTIEAFPHMPQSFEIEAKH